MTHHIQEIKLTSSMLDGHESLKLFMSSCNRYLLTILMQMEFAIASMRSSLDRDALLDHSHAEHYVMMDLLAD